MMSPAPPRAFTRKGKHAKYWLQGHGKLTPVSSFRTYLSRRKYGVTGIKLTEGARLASFLMVKVFAIVFMTV